MLTCQRQILWTQTHPNVCANDLASRLTVPQQPIPGGPLPLTRNTLHQDFLDSLGVEGIWSLRGVQGPPGAPMWNTTGHRDRWCCLSPAVRHRQSVCLSISERRGDWTQLKAVQPTSTHSPFAPEKYPQTSLWVSWIKKAAAALASCGEGRWVLVQPPEIATKHFSWGWVIHFCLNLEEGGDFYGFSENRKCVISLQLALCVVFLRVARSTLDFRSISVCCIYVKNT